VIIGEGSNTIFADTYDMYVLALMKILGTEIVHETEKDITLRVGGGVMWDDFVAHTVERGYAGAEALSLIPGTVGASPIQNIGAYGTDVSKIILSVEAYNIETNKLEVLSNQECCFLYRDSIFKKKPNTYIITHVTFLISKLQPHIPQYKDVLEYFKNSHPTLLEIRKAIIDIRTSKLPDYKKEYNCGSFFKNPVITRDHLFNIQKKFPNIPSFELPNDVYKIFAGWIIEQVDYKSAQSANFYFYPHNKLALVHTGNGTFEEFENVIQNIVKLVYNSFGITLEMEPIIFR
jgi:UDP-N-acetylmuramate dehydrogenase